ncbi:hypothetical protein SAMN02745163_03692 [Clostridium cavendishii DSM 21758]|uniref:Uncharacterized protein n=1 Tax=Clostridium cavendishii DSM 21758 TaxID=1121302 RepID=A0A1M6RWL5_9CLOT|nr:hypothetical protein [Clostridium cavendishii]SHK36945.1 hypothetical protein SAMN02745163_03692 [Clostridium cavendishii DSM 21758]
MHNIRGFIAKNKIIKSLANDFVYADVTLLNQGFSMIFLVDKLYDDINELVNSNYKIEFDDEFGYFSPAIYNLLEIKSSHGKIAYIETDYFGGDGVQAAILFEKGLIKIGPNISKTLWDGKSNSYITTPKGERAINMILKELGVYRKGNMDEFDNIGLSLYRRMD